MSEVIYKDGKRPISIEQLDRAIEMLSIMRAKLQDGGLTYDRGNLAFEFTNDKIDLLTLTGIEPSPPNRVRIHGDIEYLIERSSEEANET